MPQDYEKADHWYRIAANQGYAKAQFNLGDLYESGLAGFPKDYAKAAHWYRLAVKQVKDLVGAEDGLYGIFNCLGDLYTKDGYGLPKNYVKAYKWLLLAKKSAIKAGILTMGPDSISAIDKKLNWLMLRMPHAQIVKAQQLAREWRPSQ